MKKRLFLVMMVIVLSINLVIPVYASEVENNVQDLILKEINQNSLINITTNLMSGDMGPIGNRIYNNRTQGTPGGDSVIETTVSYFEKWGLDDVEIWTNPTAMKNIWNLKTWKIESEDYNFLPYGNWPCRNSPAGDVSGQLIYVGSGTSESDYEELDVEGKIVLADGSARSVYPQAVQRGAIGIIKVGARGNYYPETGYDTHPYSSEVVTVDRINYSESNAAPAIAISYDDGENLKNLLLEQDILINLMVDAEFIPEGDSKSVIATINGTTPGPYMILYGHLNSDSYGPGCDDNASGVACIMEIARVIQTLINEGKITRPEYSIKFFIIGTELQDSRAFLDSMTEKELSEIIGGINFDQAGLGVEHNRQNIEATDLELSQEILLICKDIIDDYKWENDYQFIPYLGGTDHQSFLNKNIPAAYIWTDWSYRAVTNPPEWGGGTEYIAGNPYYHSSGDTIENTISREPWNMVNITRMAALVTARMVDFKQVNNVQASLDEDKIYKAGSVIPVKFELKNTLGEQLTDETVMIYIDGVLGKSVDSSSDPNIFRTIANGKQYMFNLDTKGMSPGIHKIEIKLENGLTIFTTTINLK